MPQKKIHVVVDQSYIDWFYTTFGEGASLSWWVNLLLEKGVEVYKVKPEEYAKLAAEALKEDLSL